MSEVPLLWHSVDLTSFDETERAERLAQFMAEDHARRFDLARPPLLRFALIALATDRYRLVLTAHHILIDGWSVPVLVQELLTIYAQHGDTKGLPRVTPYRDYLTWLARQDRASAAVVWREALAGLQEGTRLAPATGPQGQVMPEEIHVALTVTLTAALTGLVRRYGVTLNSIVQGSWAVLLGRMIGREDVVFGITVAGRPSEIVGVERMVGLFINTVPLRVQLPPAQPLLALFKDVQKTYSNLIAHQHLGLAEIQRLCGVEELFDTLVVFENYPLYHGKLDHVGSGLRLTGVEGRDATHYALSLTVTPGDCLAIRLGYRPDLFNRAQVETLAGRFVRLLESAVAAADRAIWTFDILEPAEQRALAHGTIRRMPFRAARCWICLAGKSRAIQMRSHAAVPRHGDRLARHP
jgi:Condensation domain